MNLLIVDDDIPTTQAIADIVKKLPLPFEDVFTCYNVTAAKEIFTRQRIDIAICDIEMPKYSGLQLLEWVREQKLNTEFIFLTCHADFSYARKALRLKADAYLMKPLDDTALQNALTQAVEKVTYQEELRRRSELGELWLGQRERIENTLWHELLFGDAAAGLRMSPPNEKHRRSAIDFDLEYQLVLCSSLTTQVAERMWDQPTFRYAVSNIAGEIMFGSPTIIRVFDYCREGHIYTAVVVDASEENEKLCELLWQTCTDYLQCDMVTYLSRPCKINKLSEQRQFWEQKDRDNVVRRIPVVTREDQLIAKGTPTILDVERLRELFEQCNAVGAVNLVSRALAADEKNGHLNAQTLHRVHQDFMQVVFSYLAQEHILAHELFEDATAKQMEYGCETSLFDLIKWLSFVAKKAVETIVQTRKGETIVEKLKRYIEDHCCEALTREEIAHSVFLSPDYVSKIFKSQTGGSIKDYINDRKVERAKQMLTSGKKNVTEVAYAVGFDNFSYFSTLFKKSTGVTPSEFKKKFE